MSDETHDGEERSAGVCFPLAVSASESEIHHSVAPCSQIRSVPLMFSGLRSRRSTSSSKARWARLASWSIEQANARAKLSQSPGHDATFLCPQTCSHDQNSVYNCDARRNSQTNKPQPNSKKSCKR